MQVEMTTLPGVLLVKPQVHADARGFFRETYHAQRYHEAGIREVFVQDNHSRSSHGVLRGLHYQLQHPQGKLVSVSRGEIFDVVVDIRVGSPNFGQWYGTILNDRDLHQLYIPPAFAHGFIVLSELADLQYKCTDYYHLEDEEGIRWDDPKLAIDWPLSQPLLSSKDSVRLSLDEQYTRLRLPQFVGVK